MLVAYRSVVGGISVNFRRYIGQLSVVKRSIVGRISYATHIRIPYDIMTSFLKIWFSNSCCCIKYHFLVRISLASFFSIKLKKSVVSLR